MKRNIVVRYSKETKQNVVNAIIKGELWLEEAMTKYGINDRRTVIDWLRKYQYEQKGNIIVLSNDTNALGEHNLPGKK